MKLGEKSREHSAGKEMLIWKWKDSWREKPALHREDKRRLGLEYRLTAEEWTVESSGYVLGGKIPVGCTCSVS